MTCQFDNVHQLQAEAEFWKRSEGYRLGPTDQILGFDCGGQQWVLESCFPTGTLRYSDSSFPPFKFSTLWFAVFRMIGGKQLCPAPIERTLHLEGGVSYQSGVENFCAISPSKCSWRAAVMISLALNQIWTEVGGGSRGALDGSLRGGLLHSCISDR